MTTFDLFQRTKTYPQAFHLSNNAPHAYYQTADRQLAFVLRCSAPGTELEFYELVHIYSSTRKFYALVPALVAAMDYARSMKRRMYFDTHDHKTLMSLCTSLGWTAIDGRYVYFEPADVQ